MLLISYFWKLKNIKVIKGKGEVHYVVGQFIDKKLMPLSIIRPYHRYNTNIETLEGI
jgi:hypothetical protein